MKCSSNQSLGHLLICISFLRKKKPEIVQVKQRSKDGSREDGHKVIIHLRKVPPSPESTLVEIHPRISLSAAVFLTICPPMATAGNLTIQERFESLNCT